MGNAGSRANAESTARTYRCDARTTEPTCCRRRSSQLKRAARSFPLRAAAPRSSCPPPSDVPTKHHREPQAAEIPSQARLAALELNQRRLVHPRQQCPPATSRQPPRFPRTQQSHPLRYLDQRHHQLLGHPVPGGARRHHRPEERISVRLLRFWVQQNGSIFQYRPHRNSTENYHRA
jgi:hypothetical protein